MITYSIIQKSQLEGALRLDADYYQQEYLNIDLTITKHNFDILENIARKVSDGTHFTPQYREDGIPFISAINILEDQLNLEAGYQFISEQQHKVLYKRCDPRPKDILIRKVGVGPRYATVIPDNTFEFSIFVSVAQVRCDEGKINPYFLATFINSIYGQMQLLRFNKGISQPDLHLEEIKRLKIPIFSSTFQNQIQDIVISAWHDLEISKAFYTQAENLLLRELGLKDYQIKNELSYIVNFSEIKSASRMDSEYFQPLYKQIIEKVKNKNAKILKYYVKEYSTGYPFKSEHYQEQGIPLIRINNIKKGFLDLSDTAYLSERDYLLAKKDFASPSDIVLSMSGTIGLTAVIEDNIVKCGINQRILRITPKNINKDYLTLLLNSIVGFYQLKRIGTGGVQTNISYKDIKNILIPELSNSTQQKIADLVKKSHEARKKSKELLELAKRKVEEMIEKGK